MKNGDLVLLKAPQIVIARDIRKGTGVIAHYPVGRR